MVSYEDFIYNFADIYLADAMECCICKENYQMEDGQDRFSEQFLKLFVSLLERVEEDDSFTVNDLQMILEENRKKEILDYRRFLRNQYAKMAIEKVNQIDSGQELTNTSAFTTELDLVFNSIFGENVENINCNPVELLKHIREQEELCEGI